MGDRISIRNSMQPSIAYRLSKLNQDKHKIIGSIVNIKVLSLRTKALLLQSLIDSILGYSTDTSDLSEHDMAQIQERQT